MKTLRLIMITCSMLLSSSINCAEGRAVRPDAPELGNALLGPEMACNTPTVCCPDNVATRGCSPTVISETGFAQTLTLSGMYCLGTDLVSPLTIAGDSISLDMNGHQIITPAGGTGITVSAGFTDIRIYNGFINGNGVGLFGIFAGACIDLRIEDITCENLLVQGISLIGTLRALVSRVSANTSESGILCAGDDGTVITNSRFSNHTLNGVGFGASSVNGVIRDCIADNNANGFNIRQSTQIELYNCVAESNTAIGFIMFTSTGLLDHCVAEYNGSDGFGMQTTSDVMVKDCVATHNTGFGFNNAVASNQFYRNFACDNIAGNYNGVIAAPVAGPFNADGVDNVDCTDTSLISNCEATPIFNTGATQTLTLSGRYCLAEDITAAAATSVLVITGSSISVDLNGHTINVPAGVFPAGVGILVSAPASDVRIYNGLVNGNGVGLDGIVVDGATDVRIEDMTCANLTAFGIRLMSAANRTMISRVDVHSNGATGISCATDIGTKIVDSISSNNDQNGIGLTSSLDALVSRCVVASNTLSGIVVQGASSAVEIIDCVAERNTVEGILLAAPTVVTRCISQYNTSDGFAISGSVSIVTECIAKTNTGFGFNNGPATNQFYSNSACDNTAGNYSGVTSAPVAGPVTADGVDNVDCSIVVPVVPSDSCSVTNIYNTGVTQVLATSGRYCLAQDITVAAGTVLSITGSSIFVDLNGHRITTPAGGTGVLIGAAATDVRVYNGFINGNGVGLNGVQVTALAADLRLEDLTIERFASSGILDLGSVRSIVNRVSANNSNAGILTAAVSAVISNCSCSNNTIRGMNFSSALDTVVRECSANLNGAGGFRVETASQVELFNCTAERNTGDGFAVNNALALLDHCVAEYNIGDGFSMQTATDAMVKDCVATHNSGLGFSNSVASNQFYRNFACDNGTNYSGITSAPVAGPVTADGVDNVDCSIVVPVVPSDSCSVTNIYNTGVTQVLVNSGRYCLAQDITVAAGNVLSITGSSIFVDLNGHRITTPAGGSGVVISAGITDVRVYNGFINGNGVGTSGVSIAAALDVRLEDLTIENFTGQSAIALAGSIRTIINRVSSNTSANGLLVGTSSSGTQIIDSRFSNNTGSGILFNGTSVNSVVRGCKADINATGFSMVGSSRTELFECTAQTNTGDGFVVANALALLENCVAEYNVSDGFDLQAGSDVMVISCVATHNTGFGFNNAVAANQFYSNSACDNIAGNYNGVTSAPVAGPASADGVDNVDCSITATSSDCSPTVIFETGAPQTLILSGAYCLITDLTSPLTISGDSITLNMNGHSINIAGAQTAIHVTGDDVRIYGGRVNGDGAGLSIFGIFLDGAGNARIHDVTCTNFGTAGIDVDNGVVGLLIDNVICNNNQGDGFFCVGASDGFITNSIFSDNSGGDGMFIDSTSNLRIENCEMSGNSSTGIALISDSGIELINCMGSENAAGGVVSTGSSELLMRQCYMFNNTGSGFAISGGGGTSLFECVAESNTSVGFTAGSTDVLIEQCVARFNVSHGFNMGGVTIAMVQNSTATGNGGAGFNNLVAANQFYKNAACNNAGGNFVGVVTALVLLPDLAAAWQNAACTLP